MQVGLDRYLPEECRDIEAIGWQSKVIQRLLLGLREEPSAEFGGVTESFTGLQRLADRVMLIKGKPVHSNQYGGQLRIWYHRTVAMIRLGQTRRTGGQGRFQQLSPPGE
jgi:hypothetical protein